MSPQSPTQGRAPQLVGRSTERAVLDGLHRLGTALQGLARDLAQERRKRRQVERELDLLRARLTEGGVSRTNEERNDAVAPSVEEPKAE